MKARMLLSILLLTGCAHIGEHYYFDNACLTCYRNPITLAPNNYSVGQQYHFPLTWNVLALHQISNEENANLDKYAEDYLISEIGNRSVHLRQNEFEYRKHVAQSKAKLQQDLQNFNEQPAYMITDSASLERYNFDSESFPIRYPKSLRVQGKNFLTNLPSTYQVVLRNLDQIPDLNMSPSEAEAFMQKRNSARGIYIRYVLTNFSFKSKGIYSADVIEVQYIDLTPNMVTKEYKDTRAPFKAIAI